MIIAISTMKTVAAIIDIPDGMRLEKLKEEFDRIDFPGENPNAYETPKQTEWLNRVRLRKEKLVKLYGGERVGGTRTRVYSPLTFVGWLMKEKGVKQLDFREFSFLDCD